MKHPKSTPCFFHPEANRPIDPIQIIRRSLRCFITGIVSAIPIIGAMISLIAIQIFIQVCQQTGERFHYRFWCRKWSAFFLITVITACFNKWLGFACLILCIGMWAFQLILGWCIVPPVWNPARRYLFLGFGFASVSLLVHGVVAAYPLLQNIAGHFR